MDRRQLLKGLAALPLARLSYAYAASLCNGTCTPVKDSLLVWLEGAFAVVINRDGTGKPVDITAFSPVDADHLTQIASLPQGAYPEQFHLTLQGAGVKPAATVCISSDFSSFCIEQLGKIQGNPENAFIRLKLPLPRNIYTTELLKGKLAGKNACIPQDHVFEYETDTTKPIALYYEDNKQSLQPDPKNKFFHIEVGLDPSTASADAIAHAKHFHKTILAHFGWQNDVTKQITDFSMTPCRGTIPKEIADRLVRSPLETATLECKSGGIIGGSP
jgi:hypothetical protein